MFGKLTVLAALVALLVVPLARAATTDTATAEASPGPYFVGVPITFTSTTPCTTACRLTWKYLSGTRLGEQLGEGVSVQRVFSTSGLKTVQLDLSELCVGTSQLTCDSFAYVSVNVEATPLPIDTTAPTITASGLQVEATGPTTVVNYSFAATDPDDLVVSQSCSPAPGAAFPLGATPIGCAAVDSNGNVGTASFTVVVSDTVGPVVTVPSGLIAEATSAAGALVSFNASAGDLVDGAVATTCSTPSGSIFPLGSTTVTCTASDLHGNTGTGSFNVVVADSTAPTLSLPGTITVDATAPAGAVVDYTATASDLVDGSVTPSAATGSFANASVSPKKVFYLELKVGQCALRPHSKILLVVPCSNPNHYLETYAVLHGVWGGGAQPAHTAAVALAQSICRSTFQRRYGHPIPIGYGFEFYYPDAGSAEASKYRDRVSCSLRTWPSYRPMGAGNHLR